MHARQRAAPRRPEILQSFDSRSMLRIRSTARYSAPPPPPSAKISPSLPLLVLDRKKNSSFVSLSRSLPRPRPFLTLPAPPPLPPRRPFLSPSLSLPISAAAGPRRGGAHPPPPPPPPPPRPSLLAPQGRGDDDTCRGAAPVQRVTAAPCVGPRGSRPGRHIGLGGWYLARPRCLPRVLRGRQRRRQPGHAPARRAGHTGVAPH